MTTGDQHYEAAEKMIDNLGGEKDAEWAKVGALRALVHAVLANAAPKYGRHIAHPSNRSVILDDPSEMREAEPTVAPAEVVDIFRKRDIAALQELLDDGWHPEDE